MNNGTPQVMNGNGHLTTTQKRMMAVLSDGLPHDRHELHACLDDELSALTAIQPHLTYIRKAIRGRGEDVLCVYHGRTVKYQHVRVLYSPYDGRT
jgi:hypothetical protein